MQLFLATILLFLAGLAIILYGYRLFMRFLPIWGFFTGFWLGARIASQLLGQGFLGTTTGWVAGVVLGAVFAAISLKLHKIGMALNAASIGYGIGIGLASVLGFDSRLIISVIGLVMAGLVVVFAVKNNLRVLALIVITTTVGVRAFLASLMLFFKTISLSDLQNGVFMLMADNSWYWSLLGLVAAIIGIVFQVRANRSEFPWGNKVSDGNDASAG